MQIRPLSLRELFLVRYPVHGLADGFVVRYGFARAPTQACVCACACVCVRVRRIRARCISWRACNVRAEKNAALRWKALYSRFYGGKKGFVGKGVGNGIGKR